MARLRLHLLGTFQAILDGETLSAFRSDKTRALLAYLAIEGGRPHSRDALAGLLWGDYAQEAARASLRAALSNVRELLSPLLRRPAQEPLLTITRQNITLNQEHADLWVDATRFDWLMSQCQRHVHEELARCSACMTHLGEASELYRGEFLTGLLLPDSPAWDEWRLLQQEARHQQMLAALNALAAYHTVMNQDERALAYLRQTLALAPWHEAAHRQAMSMLARLGRRGEALAQYETCRRVLAEELGSEPEAETVALYEAIRQRRGTSSTSPSSPRHNLPPQATPFIGRERELEQLGGRLLDPSYRMITLVGEGGVGKTRLALAAAANVTHGFADGVWFVPLAGAGEQEQESKRAESALVGVIANALSFSFYGEAEPQKQLLDYLRQKEMLLLLDNFEHLLGAASFAHTLWRNAPGVTLLSTSRERLNFQAEYAIRVAGLPVPAADDDPQAAGYSSLQLFAERADRAPAGFTLNAANTPGVSQVCRLVEGTPLAIELAAAWVEQWSPAEMAQAIRRSLDFLVTTMADVPARHRSMRAVFEYSWQLLIAPEQVTLAQASVFRGGFTLEAAERIFALEPSPRPAGVRVQERLAALVEKSLLRRPAAGRYEMHELLRQFATEKLEGMVDSAYYEQTRQRHSDFYLAFVSEREAALHGAELQPTLADIRGEVDNVRRAWRWAVQQTRVAAMQKSLPALARFYAVSSRFQEAESLLIMAVEHLRPLLVAQPDGEMQLVWGHLLVEQAAFLSALGRYDQAIATARAAVEVGQAAKRDELIASAYLHWGVSLWYQGNVGEAHPRLEQALSLAQAIRPRSISLQELLVDCLRALGSVSFRLGEYAGASAYYEQSLRLAQAIGDQHGESQALGSLGVVAKNLADYTAAYRYYQQCLQTNRELGDRHGEGGTLNSLGDVLFYRGEYLAARRHYEQSLHIAREIGNLRGEAIALNNLGTVYHSLGAYPAAQSYYEQALQLKRQIGFQRGEGWGLLCLGLLFHHQNNHAAAQEQCRQALNLFDTLGDRIGQGFALNRLGHTLAGLGKLKEATDVYQKALAIRRELKQPHQAMETVAGLARVALAQNRPAEALAYVEEILDYLQGHNLDGAYERFRVYLTCYQVLQAAQDGRASLILAEAKRLLQLQAAGIDDEQLRRSFLEDVPAHRELRLLAEG